MQTPGQDLISVELDIRNWRAKEGLRQCELRLASQALNLTAMESRATSVLTWCMAGLTGLSLATGGQMPRNGVLVSIILLALAGGACVAALWPRNWAMTGFHSVWEDALDLPSITEIIESMSISYIRGISSNTRRLRNFSRLMCAAWLLFLLAPLPLAIAFHFFF